jgi:hypothetical protein
MTEPTSLAATSPTPVEQPTSSARMTLSLRPVEIEGTAEGVVPAGEAHALITTFGTITMGVAGIAGAAITVHIAPSRALGLSFGLALAELVLALVVIVLIARRDHFPAGARGSRARVTATAADHSGRGSSKARRP